MEIRSTTPTEIFANPNCEYMLKCYADESAVEGMPMAKASRELYLAYESQKRFIAFGAFHDGLIVGVITILAAMLPHYSEKVTTLESWFVLKEFRNKGTGLKLLDLAMGAASSLGAAGLFVSTPHGGVLEKVLRRHERFTHTNDVFFTRL